MDCQEISCQKFSLFPLYLCKYLLKCKKNHNEKKIWKVFFEMPPSRNLQLDPFRNYDKMKVRGMVQRDKELRY